MENFIQDEKIIPYEELHRTAESVGMKIISDAWCCKLLAWLLAYGGANEAVTLNYKLHTDLKAAQRRLNIVGGEIPNTELLPVMQNYWREIERWLNAPQEPFEHPAWVVEIFNYYGLKVPK